MLPPTETKHSADKKVNQIENQEQEQRKSTEKRRGQETVKVVTMVKEKADKRSMMVSEEVEEMFASHKTVW